MYYLDVDFYRYFIGREDQSVNEKVMISRIDQQIKVNKLMVDMYSLYQIPNRQLRNYMFNYLEIITIVSTVMCLRSGTDENLMKKRELWGYIKAKDIRMFHRLRNGICRLRWWYDHADRPVCVFRHGTEDCGWY